MGVDSVMLELSNIVLGFGWANSPADFVFFLCTCWSMDRGAADNKIGYKCWFYSDAKSNHGFRVLIVVSNRRKECAD